MTRRSLYLFIFSILLLMVIAFINYLNFQKRDRYTEVTERSHALITTLQDLSGDFKSLQIYSPQYEKRAPLPFYRAYREESNQVKADLQRVNELVSDDPVRKRNWDFLSGLIQAQIDTLMRKNIVELIEAGQSNRLKDLHRIDVAIKGMLFHEKQMLQSEKGVLYRSTRQTYVLSVILAIMGLLVLLFSLGSNFVLERKRTWLENFLSSILDTSQNAIVAFTSIRDHGAITDFRIEYVNKAIEPLLGLKPEDVVGKKVSEFPFLVQVPDLMQRFTGVVQTGEPAAYENAFRAKGTDTWFYVRLTRRGDGLTATFHDITPIKKSQQQLEENVEQLRRSNASLEEFAYIASHDLQEPLRKILTFGNLLLERQGDRLEVKGKEHLEKIMNSAIRMSRLIQDILKVSSVRQDEFIPTDLNEIVDQVLSDLELLIAQKEAAVETVPLPVLQAIPLQMHQLIYNLVNNALKFTAQGRQQVISIHCRALPDEERALFPTLRKSVTYYEFLFTDQGIGFKNEQAEQIFGMFKRLHNRHDYAGSGIGLALCRKVVENHQGLIYARAEEGKGARFYVLLPVRQVQG